MEPGKWERDRVYRTLYPNTYGWYRDDPAEMKKWASELKVTLFIIFLSGVPKNVSLFSKKIGLVPEKRFVDTLVFALFLGHITFDGIK